MATATQAPGQAFTSTTAKLKYVIAGARSRNLDPAAVIAVWLHEDASGAPGDNNTSFGPWQLHAGGALPQVVWAQGPTYAQNWANSPAGIDYALNAIANVAKGQTGTQAISSIVNNFEHPLNPQAEVSSADSNYSKASFIVSTGGNAEGAAGVLSNVPGANAATSGVESATGAITSTAGLIGEITSTAFWIRAGEVVGGAVLMLAGLFLLAKQIGLAPPPVPAPAQAVAAAAPATSVEGTGPPRRVESFEPSDAADVNRRARVRAAQARRSQPREEIPF